MYGFYKKIMNLDYILKHTDKNLKKKSKIGFCKHLSFLENVLHTYNLILKTKIYTKYTGQENIFNTLCHRNRVNIIL